MENLSDDLLIEIWSRVPYKTAVRGKSISKRFLALISQLQFIQRSILHHHTMKQDENHKEWKFNFISKRKLLISFIPNLNLSTPQNQISFSFLGRKFDPKLDNMTRKKHVLYSKIVGFSNGLFLCKKTSRGRVYHVCNILTKEYVKLPLPPPPLTGHNKRDRVSEGFVCEPYYRIEENTKKVTLNNHRFSVVRFPRFDGTTNEMLWGITKSEFEMVVFSSETGKWNKKTVSCSNGFTQSAMLPPGFAHQGIFGASPNDIIFNGHIGVCRGKIRIACYNNIGCSVMVWELENVEEEYSWCLLHKIRFAPMPLDCIVDELLRTGGRGEIVDMGTRVRAFHPYDGDVVFLQRIHRIFVGNLKMNKFEGVGYGNHGFDSLQMVSLDFPLWPTPIPSI
ncbi:hypothetical protein P8452_20601 [Trifolium repens]|nr:hypothetical protein P8452_20601 [Trifolium repens]